MTNNKTETNESMLQTTSSQSKLNIAVAKFGKSSQRLDPIRIELHNDKTSILKEDIKEIGVDAHKQKQGVMTFQKTVQSKMTAGLSTVDCLNQTAEGEINSLPQNDNHGSSQKRTPSRSKFRNAVIKSAVISQALNQVGLVDPEKPENWGDAKYLIKLCDTNYSPLETVRINYEPMGTFSRSRILKHLQARHVKTNESLAKIELVKLLISSVEEERRAEIDKLTNAEGEFQELSRREQSGAVYAVGRNDKGQCGLGLDFNSTKQVDWFTVIPVTRGMGVQQVTSCDDITFAVVPPERDDDPSMVFTWGGCKIGPTGLDLDESESEASMQNLKPSAVKFQINETPIPIHNLCGEQISQLAVGSSHGTAVTVGGDIYTWGDDTSGILGTCNTERKKTKVARIRHGPSMLLVKSFQNPDQNVQFVQVASGAKHTCALARNGDIYSWGYGVQGRLGVGEQRFKTPNGEVEDAKEHHSIFIDRPRLCMTMGVKMRKVSCGAQHTLAVSASGQIFAWGCGDNGRLGTGDLLDRWSPSRVSTLRKHHAVDISAGTWHSACVTIVPPLKRMGWLYTWGSGLHGQLGMGLTTLNALTPTFVKYFHGHHLGVKNIFCGSHHNAAITSDGELYTWGLNQSNCLGRSFEQQKRSFSPTPGHCSGFGAIIDRVGRGKPRSVACGKGFTIVATYPYDGPPEVEAIHLMEEHKIKLKLNNIQLAKNAREKEETQQNNILKDEAYQRIKFLTAKRLCSIDPRCPGFQVHPLKSSICRECGHSETYHTVVVERSPTKS